MNENQNAGEREDGEKLLDMLEKMCTVARML
jgi:hypothetical protein